jgi:excisionase family DNA binding protein
MTTTSSTETLTTPAAVPLLTIDEAADYLAITKATLYTWRSRRTGYGPRAVKLGGCLRYRRSDLDAWILEHVEPEGDPVDSEDSMRGRAPHPGAGISLSRKSGRRAV